MKESRTLSLIKNAFDKIQAFNYKQYENSSQNASYDAVSNRKFQNKGYIINALLEKFGLHLTHKSTYENFLRYGYNVMGKWSCVGTFMLAIQNPEKFDEIYNLFSDEDSKSIFDWFIQYRTAYAFLGNLAGEIFPAGITKPEFESRKSDLNINNGSIKIGGFTFNSSEIEVTLSWLLNAYELKGKCEVNNGDYVIDGGSFKGETAFWFLSKGAGKVYAFEPDPYNFSILSHNISRNKVNGKVIPIEKVLLDKNGSIAYCATSNSGASGIIKGDKIIQSVTLDSFVKEEKLKRVDLIKLDVEGSELKVLRGASQTIKEFKPKLAICVYHKPNDLVHIIDFLHESFPAYKFYLSHKSPFWSETVLFAVNMS